jgi:hypothetical protein
MPADLYGMGGGSRLQPVTIKAPALRFRQQLDVLLQKILPKIRDRVKRRIMPMLVRRKRLASHMFVRFVWIAIE